MAENVEIIKWNKNELMTKEAIIRFQIVAHCHFMKIHISSADLDCLVLLGKSGKVELTAFCEFLTTQPATIDEIKRETILKQGKKLPTIFKSSQSSRNAITRLEQDKGLIIKEGRNKKKIFLNPDLKIQGTGNVFVDIKCFSPIKDPVQ